MPYGFKNISDVPREIRRIVEEQIDRAIGEIDGDLDAPDTVHQVRKRCKKIRAVLHLARDPLDKDDAYSVENTRFRDIAGRLSVLRDAQALIDTHGAVSREIDNPDVQTECAAIHGRLTTRRRRIAEGDAGLDARLRAARVKLIEGRNRVPGWARRVRGFESLQPGLEKTYRRGRRTMAAACKRPSDDAFHEFRKRVKYHWYACRLLRGIWPAEMDARRGELRRLSELLGDEHDLSLYCAMLESEADRFGHTTRLPDILTVADRQRGALRRQAHPAGLRLYAEKPGRLSARFRKYWQSRKVEISIEQGNPDHCGPD